MAKASICFFFLGSQLFIQKKLDKVFDLDASEGFEIVIAGDIVGGLIDDLLPSIADTKMDLKQLSKDGYVFPALNQRASFM